VDKYKMIGVFGDEKQGGKIIENFN